MKAKSVLPYGKNGLRTETELPEIWDDKCEVRADSPSMSTRKPLPQGLGCRCVPDDVPENPIIACHA